MFDDLQCLYVCMSVCLSVCLSVLQNSRDNMTVILVTFPGAPRCDEKAAEKV